MLIFVRSLYLKPNSTVLKITTKNREKVMNDASLCAAEKMR